MSAFAEWMESLEEWLEYENTRDALMERGSKDWQISTDYAFALAASALKSKGVSVRHASTGLVFASALASLSALLAWAFLLELLPPLPLLLSGAAVPFILFNFRYAHLMNTLGISARRIQIIFMVIGAGLCLAVVVLGRSQALLQLGLITITAVTTVCVVAAYLAWIRPNFRFRFNLLEVTRPRGGMENSQAFFLAISNVAYAVCNLRKAQRIGAEQFANCRKQYGATPGQRAYGAHPLDLTDRQFSSDLEQLLVGRLPETSEKASRI